MTVGYIREELPKATALFGLAEIVLRRDLTVESYYCLVSGWSSGSKSGFTNIPFVSPTRLYKVLSSYF